MAPVDFKAIEEFLAHLRHNLKAKQSTQPQFCKKVLKIAIDGRNWILDGNNSFTESGNQEAPSPDCTLISSGDTMNLLISGEMTPTAAYLSGKLKLDGDWKVFKEIGAELKEAFRTTTKPVTNTPMDIFVRVTSASKAITADGDEVIKFVLEVTNKTTSESWKISHRFSEFIVLRTLLMRDGFHLPRVRGQSYFKQNSSLIKRRMEFLTNFINTTIAMVGYHNETLNKFIGNDNRGLFLTSHSEINKTDDIQRNSMKAILEHTAAPIPWKETSFAHSNSLISEIGQLKAKISALETQSGGGSVNAKEKIASIFSSMANYTVLFLSLVSYARFHTASDAAAGGRDATGEGILWYDIALLSALCCMVGFTRRRLRAVAYTAVAAAASMLYTAVTEGNMVFAEIRWDSSVASGFMVKLANALMDYGQNVFGCLCSAPQWNIAQKLLFTLPLLLVMMVNFSKIRRSLQIYGLGFGLIVFYAVLMVATKAMRLSEAGKERFYEKIDAYVAPFIVYQIGELRSIFVKFAQYAGGRSDMMSSVWSSELSRLHDQCPASSLAYVKRTIIRHLIHHHQDLKRQQRESENTPTSSVSVKDTTEEEIKFEDIFVSFEETPLASASIGQVHVATINLTNVRKFLLNTADPETLHEANLEEVMESRTNPLFSTQNKGSSGSSMIGPSSAAIAGGPTQSKDTLSVVVKIQHEHIAAIMMADMSIVIFLVKLALKIDSRWEAFLTLLYGWQRTMEDELNFQTEANNLTEMKKAMDAATYGVAVPLPVPGLVCKDVLVMSRLHGYKVTDKVALNLYGVDKVALLRRIAHCCAWQLLVAGVFNADPHPGNVMFCLSNNSSNNGSSLATKRSDSLVRPRQNSLSRLSSLSSVRNSMASIDRYFLASSQQTDGTVTAAGSRGGAAGGSAINTTEGIIPGLLDFGMTVRLKPERRRAYCKLILALLDGDMKSAADTLKEVGYRSNQSHRAPERDAEFFEYLLRDANPKAMSMQERTAFNKRRNDQKLEDIANGVREKGGRSIAAVPDDFIFLTRVIGLLRGLTAELDCGCPILYILALNAKVGLHT